MKKIGWEAVKRRRRTSKKESIKTRRREGGREGRREGGREEPEYLDLSFSCHFSCLRFLPFFMFLFVSCAVDRVSHLPRPKLPMPKPKAFLSYPTFHTHTR